MSQGRRRAPEPAIPVGGGTDSGLAPPQQFNPEEDQSKYVPEGQLLTPSGAPVTPPSELPIATDEPQEEQEPEPEPEELSPEEQVMFASLMTCGRRTKTIQVLDHSVVVQTLNNDDDLRIALYVKDYVGTIGEQRAYQVAVAAAGIRTVDGGALVQPLYESADPNEFFDQKIKKVEAMYPHVTKQIYNAVLGAEKEFVELVTRLGKLPG